MIRERDSLLSLSSMWGRWERPVFGAAFCLSFSTWTGPGYRSGGQTSTWSEKKNGKTSQSLMVSVVFFNASFHFTVFDQSAVNSGFCVERLTRASAWKPTLWSDRQTDLPLESISTLLEGPKKLLSWHSKDWNTPSVRIICRCEHPPPDSSYQMGSALKSCMQFCCCCCATDEEDEEEKQPLLP